MIATRVPYYLSPVEIELVQDYLLCPSTELDLSYVTSALHGATSILILGADDPESAYVPSYARNEGDPSSLSCEIEGATRIRKSIICGEDIPALQGRLQDVESLYDAFSERMLELLHGAEIVRISYVCLDGES